MPPETKRPSIGDRVMLNEYCGLHTDYYCKHYNVIAVCDSGIWVDIYPLFGNDFIPNKGFVITNSPSINVFKFC